MTEMPLIWASFFSTKNIFILFLKVDYLILIYHEKHTLEIYLEKLLKNGGFTLLNKPLEPGNLS